MQRLLFPLFVPVLLAVALCAAPRQSLAAATGSAGPTTVTSQKVEYHTDRQTVVFTGSVHVITPDMEIRSEKLTVLLAKERSGQSSTGIGLSASEIEQIIAEVNVFLKKDDRVGECEKATYTAKDDLMVMEGDPRLLEGGNSITGTKILFWMSENRSEVIGAPDKPVQVIFTQESSNQQSSEAQQQPASPPEAQ